jgi:hypothetical protein
MEFNRSRKIVLKLNPIISLQILINSIVGWVGMKGKHKHESIRVNELSFPRTYFRC